MVRTRPRPNMVAVPGSGRATPSQTPTSIDTLLVSMVTPPCCEKALPHWMLAPVFKLMLSKARIFPAKAVSLPSVAVLPTCQNTFSPYPPFLKTIDDKFAVVSEFPIRKRKTACGSPWASKCEGSVQKRRRTETIDAGRQGKSTEILAGYSASARLAFGRIVSGSQIVLSLSGNGISRGSISLHDSRRETRDYASRRDS